MARKGYKLDLFQHSVHFAKDERDEDSLSELASWVAMLPWPEVSRLIDGSDVTVGVWCKIRTDPSNPVVPSSALDNHSGVIERLYQPLPSPRHIRLLQVEPGAVNGTIQSQLLMISLDRCPKFHALSYVWGDAKCVEIIECNGQYLRASYNAAVTIRHLRSVRQPILLWVDSICINQSDMMEKNIQVGLMAQIYRKATEVDIWLQEGTGSSDLGMEILDHVARLGIRSSDHPPPWKLRAPELLREGLRDVMGRDWWSRGWTVQEMALACRPRIVCGGRSVSWAATSPSIRAIIRNIKLVEISYVWEEAGLASISLQPLLNLLQEQLKQVSPESLLESPDIVDVMHSFRDKKFSDPRDRIHAMLGLSPNIDFQPDYSLSLEETWENFLKAVDADYTHQSTTVRKENCRIL